MTRLLTQTLSWACLAVILGAALGHPLALRMEGAAAVLVGINNAMIVIGLLVMLVPEKQRELAEMYAKQGPTLRGYRAFWLIVKTSVLEGRNAR